MKDRHLGELEELTLLIVVGLGPDAYGATVQQGLERHAGRRIALGAVYGALARLERKGFVTSSLCEASGKRGGRRKRVFAQTAAGARALRASRQTRERLWRMAEATEL